LSAHAFRKSTKAFMPSAATPFHASPARRIAWSIALVVGCAHAGLGFWLTFAVISRKGLILGWWIPCVASLLCTLPATLAARSNSRAAGRWLIAAACLGVFAIGRALHLNPSHVAVNVLVWWLPQLVFGLFFLGTNRVEAASHGAESIAPAPGGKEAVRFESGGRIGPFRSTS